MGIVEYMNKLKDKKRFNDSIAQECYTTYLEGYIDGEINAYNNVLNGA